jgi:leucyl aminopeptidase
VVSTAAPTTNSSANAMVTVLGVEGWNGVPSLVSAAVSIAVAQSVPASATIVGVPVASAGPVPGELGLDRAALSAVGFDAGVGQTLPLPRSGGPVTIAVGIGDPAELDLASLRDAAAAFARAASKHSHLAVMLAADATSIPVGAIAEALLEGVVLARYRYDAFKGAPSGVALAELTLVAAPERSTAISEGVRRARIMASATELTRDVGNAPPTYMTATRMAEVATEVAARNNLDIDVFDREALLEMGCGGLLGVNAGSAEPPRMIKLTYRPRTGTARGHLAMVGKGIMYDSGGINLKPGDAMHALMKLDMAGAGAILGAMSGLSALDCATAVTGYLMCTDNMPSGSAMKMGDVLRIRGGKTVEVQNTDAEGRLVLSDGLVLAAEEHPDAIVDIATLTGASLRALGPKVAAVFGNNQALVDQVSAAASRTDEPVWQLPLDKRYRSQINSEIADLSNMGSDGASAGAITAALFLAEFVGGVPWAHVDIAGTMATGSDDSWRPRGATGFGARLLLDLAVTFTPPKV